MKTLDRYVIREVLWPLVIGLLIFTFILIIPVLLTELESLVARGVPGGVILRVMWALVPQSLALTIPMSVLLGLLVAFGRLSADREFVAMQACGVSLFRLMRPVAVVSVVACLACGYVLLVSVPNGNQTYREIVFRVIADRAESNVKPRVFFEDFPDLVLYVREVPPTGGWKGVFMADTRPGQPVAVYLAEHGRVAIDREKRTAEVVLENGTRHTADAAGQYEVFGFRSMVLEVDPERMFARAGPEKGEREMTVGELRAHIARLEAQDISAHNARMEIHKKFSIPVAALVFGLIGLALGASNRRDGKLASFVLGIAVIFVYYVLLYIGLAMVKGHMMPPWLGIWLPNLVLGPAGLLLFARRDRAADGPILRFRLPRRFARAAPGPAAEAPPPRVLRLGLPRLRVFAPGILDRYVTLTYLRVFGLAFAGLLCVFYIATFLDHSDKVFKGQATWSTLLTYFQYQTAEYVYYVIPLAVLLASLVTIGLLTKNSELVVMKACGISLYRIALPTLLCGLAAGGALFALEETILGPWTRRAYAIRHVMRGGSPQTFDVLQRRWLVAADGDIYHYAYFDPRTRQLSELSVYEFAGEMARLERRVFAERAIYLDAPEDGADWRGERGWIREFDENGETRRFTPFAETALGIAPADYFATEQPEPKYMSYSQLRGYVDRLRASGFDVSEQEVALARKMSFPFVTLIMTLIAVPFAVTTGRRGAMYGIGVGIALAIVYWVAISIFGALGSGGLVAPALAAWAPNLLFGAGAAYLLLTVRT